MADSNANPSLNPSNNDSMVGMLRQCLSKFLQDVDDMLPAKVIAFDRQKNIVQVQPMIMVLNTNKTTISRAQIAAIPVLQLGGGGFMMNFNLNPGDLGFIKANDRDISLFMQSFKESGPNTLRKHKFEDAIFIPAPMTGFSIAGEDAECMVIQSLDGSLKISLGDGRIKITAPDIQFVSDTLTHNGVNVGDDHRHSGVETGPSNTGVPV